MITLSRLAGISQVFLSAKKSFTSQNSLARQQENGRYVLDTLGQDLRRAGYLGSLEGITAVGGTAGDRAPGAGQLAVGRFVFGDGAKAAVGPGSRS